jgi:hypothetical protein
MKHKPKHAVTLVELILTFFIIVMVLLPIFSSYSASHQNTRVTLEEVIAVNFASEIIEALQALPFDQLGLINSELDFQDGEFTPDPFAVALEQGNKHGISQRNLPQNFKTHVLVDSYPDSGYLVSNTNLLIIKITINWGARNREVVLSTLKGRY